MNNQQVNESPTLAAKRDFKERARPTVERLVRDKLRSYTRFYYILDLRCFNVPEQIIESASCERLVADAVYEIVDEYVERHHPRFKLWHVSLEKLVHEGSLPGADMTIHIRRKLFGRF